MFQCSFVIRPFTNIPLYECGYGSARNLCIAVLLEFHFIRFFRLLYPSIDGRVVAPHANSVRSDVWKLSAAHCWTAQ